MLTRAHVGGGREALVTFQAGPQLDAFGRLRVSQNHILLSGQLNYADNPLIWDTQLTNNGTATYLVNESALSLAVTDDAGSEVIRQTKRYWLYRAGQSQLARITFAEGTPEADVRKRVGYFDAGDGIFFEINGTTDLAFTIRTSVSGAPVVFDRKTHTDWNQDKLDGSGPSKLTLDVSKIEQLTLDLQWLGVGPVRVGFVIGGRDVHVHTFEIENIVAAVPYMKTASLPVRYELTNLAASAGTFKQICATVIREGGSEEEGIPTGIRSPLSGVTRLTATTTPRSAIVVRLRSSHIRAFLKPVGVALMNFGTTAETIAWDLVVNPVLGGVLTFVEHGEASEAAKVLAQQQIYTPGSGHCIASGLVPGGTNQAPDPVGTLNIESLLGIASNIAGTSDLLALIVESASGSPPITAVVDVSELF